MRVRHTVCCFSLSAMVGLSGCNRSPEPVAQLEADSASAVPSDQGLPPHVDIGSAEPSGGANPQPYGAAAPLASGSDGQAQVALNPPVLSTAGTMIDNAPTGAGASPGSNTGPTTTQPVSLGATELRFFAQAGEFNIFEARVAQVAADKANDSAIKSYASLLMMDEAGMASGLQQLSGRLGIPLVTSLSAVRQEAAEGLNRATPESFDRQFMQLAGARAQQNTIALFEQTAREATNPAVQDFANAALPMLRAHLEAARKLPIHE